MHVGSDHSLATTYCRCPTLRGMGMFDAGRETAIRVTNQGRNNTDPRAAIAGMLDNSLSEGS